MDASDDTAFLRFEDWRNIFCDNLQSKSWQVLYHPFQRESEEGLIYSALIPNEVIADSLNDHSWDLCVGDGSPGTSETRNGEIKVVEYDRLGFLGGVEPLVLCRTFHHGAGSFRELSEEFRLFHNLYQGKKRDEYLKADEVGNVEVVAKISAERVEVRTKEIRQFLAIKEMHLAIQVDINRFSERSLETFESVERSEQYRDKDACFNWGIRSCNWRKNAQTHAYIMGKKLLPPLAKERSARWPFSEPDEHFPTFIIGRDDEGNDVESTCKHDKLANNFGANSNAPHYLTPVHFRAEVLARYYSHADRFSVEDGYLRAGGLWGLRMDNDHRDRIVVFLGDLGRDLPASERDYWRGFNIAPDGPLISRTAFSRSIRGWFASPERLDLAFKNLFPYFCQKWRDTFDWDLFLPLGDDDTHHFTSLRIPLQNDQGEFDSQVQSLTKLMIDSLNEANIVIGLSVPEKAKGIGKFQCFLQDRQVADSYKIVEFLRNLQALRSSGVAHRKGSAYKKVAKIFDLENRELKEVAAELFAEGQNMLKTLGSHFIPSEDWNRL